MSRSRVDRSGDKDRAAWKEEIGTDLPAADSQLRQSVASHASTRYEGLAADDLLGSPQASIGVSCFCTLAENSSVFLILSLHPKSSHCFLESGKREILLSASKALKSGDWEPIILVTNDGSGTVDQVPESADSYNHLEHLYKHILQLLWISNQSALQSLLCLQSDSDFNPVEEPTWLQQDSLHATHFSYVLNSSPSDTPRIRAFGVEESTAVASPMRHQNVRAALANNSSMEEILSFVQDKARILFS